MSDDAFFNNYGGTDASTKPAPLEIIRTNNVLTSVFCDMSNYPGQVKDYTVSYNYEAYFTGAIDSASLALDVKNANSKLVGYLANKAGFCKDGLSCTAASSLSCIAQFSNSKIEKALMGVSKNTTDVIQTKYLCEQPKPLKQLPVFNRYVCIPVSASITVSLASTLTQSEVETVVTNAISTGMATGDLNTAEQIIGLVYSPKPSTTLNKTGSVRKHMRPLGIGLLTAGCVVLFLLIVSFIVCRCRRNRNDDGSKESLADDDDDLSLEKDKDDEESNVLTVSYMSDESTPVKKGPSKK